MKKYNLIWESDVTIENDFRSSIAGYPIYDMKCNKCLIFIGAYQKQEDCKIAFCSNCGQKIIEEEL